MPVLKVLDRITAKLIGTVEAGACIPEYHCCCKPGSTWALNCYGGCVASTSCFPASHQNC